ncbi:MAG TPA: chemotaxis protein CheD [Bacillota bacterium]|nr:chemotaxis protein CheD [Bacillota bacterium]
MPPTIEVSTADFAVAEQPTVLISRGVGSCVVICLYDSTRKLGALCHIMLPKRPENADLNPLRFADTAIPLALNKLVQLGGQRSELFAYVVGGANMFQNLGTFVNKIGDQNVTAVQTILAQLNIPIRTTDVGGDQGRSVSFSLDSGALQVTH